MVRLLTDGALVALLLVALAAVIETDAQIPATGQVWQWNGKRWSPSNVPISAPGFNGTGTGPPAVMLGNATITSGTGVPLTSCSTGSLYLRSDGGPGSTLYVCENGWKAK